MHIVRVCPAYYPYFYLGGSVIADYELDKALVNEGHSVTVLTCKDKKTDKECEYLSENHKVIRFSSLGAVKYGLSFGPIFKLFSNKDNDIDVVWFGGVWSLLSIFGPLLCRILSLKYIITPHGMLIPALIEMKSAFLKKAVIKLLLKKHLSKAYKVHFTVKQEYEETLLATNSTMTPLIFPLCFDLTRFDQSPETVKKGATLNNSEKITLSFIGRITQKKRIDLVVNALQLLPEVEKKKIKFNVIGIDEGVWDKKVYIESLVGVEINYIGPLYGNDLVKAYHETDVFILCSESENFAISVVEAAYCYCVPLISENVGVGQYFNTESAVFSSLNSNEMKQKIEFLINNPSARKEISLSARAVSEQFNSAFLGDEYFLKLLS